VRPETSVLESRTARRDTALLHYGFEVHKKYTNICVMDSAGTILAEGRSDTDQLPTTPLFLGG
jgi:hypothetical protein